MNGLGLGLGLKRRLRATWEWAISVVFVKGVDPIVLQFKCFLNFF